MRRIPLLFIVKRLMFLVVVVWFAATLNFVLPRIAARDPVTEYLTELAAVGGRRGEQIDLVIDAYRDWAGLNYPLWQQYLTYLRNMLRMDFGRSFRFYRSVNEVIAYALPWTVGLLGTTTLLAFGLGLILGALIGWPTTPKVFHLFVPLLMILSVLPPFIVALVLMDSLAFRLGLFPLTGPHSPTIVVNWMDPQFLLNVAQHAVLPALSMLLVTTGIYAMGMRGMIITVSGADFITYAEVKGLKRWRIFLRYGIRNCLLPQVTALGMSLGTLVSGVTLVEIMFAYPGLGSVLESAIRAFDYNVIQGVVFFLITGIAVFMFILDLAYPLLDPRISYSQV